MQWVALTALITIPVACNNVDLPVDKPQTNTNKVSIRASISESQPETRMDVTDNGIFGAENMELRWKEGDSFTVSQDATEVTFTIDKTTISADGKSATFTTEEDVSGITSGTAYFGETTAERKPTVPVSQSATALFAGKKLPMKAEGIDLSTDGTGITDIAFKHMAYVLKFTFWLPAGVADPTEVTLTTTASDALLVEEEGTATNTHSFELTEYSFGGKATYFNVYIPLLQTDVAFGSLGVSLNDGSPGTFAATNTSSPAFEAGKMYLARISFDSDGTGSLVQSSEFNTVVANKSIEDINNAGIEYGNPTGGDTEDDPILIRSAQELKKLILETSNKTNNYANKYFKLTTDIHVTADTWTPLGGYYKDFFGNFDGNGHNITGELNIKGSNSGFFGYMFNNTNEIEIKNLTVAANVISSSEGIGGIIGKIQMTNGNGSTVTIKNCHFSGNLTGSYHLGGVLGDANITENSAPTVAVKIENCTSHGSIIANGTDTYDAVGGIIGIAGTKSIITSCINYAQITGNNSTDGRVGGIAGTCTNATISDCVNYGNVTGNNCLGGILGSVDGTGNNFIRNENYGSIGYTTSIKVGGIFGEDYWGNSTYTDNINYSESISGSSFVGGLWGMKDGYNDGTGNINNTSVPDKGEDGTAYPTTP